MSSHVINNWNPEDEIFWEQTGKSIAARNLWISIPALLLAFSVWMVWSVVCVNLPNIGFDFTTNQLFWLTALPGLSGATLRIFFSFMVPIFGGRVWTTVSTLSLIVPAIGIGLAVQDPHTSYTEFMALALLCGLGGGNFASSMANISFFFPKNQQGTALGLNAGIGNLGVSAMQFVVPLVITSGMFGAFAGEPQLWKSADEAHHVWLQNAGFIWVPFILLSTALAWTGMNDLASAKFGMKEQAIIFTRKHNWLMCWLYLGTFGSFIGYAAGFPLLIKAQFPDINPMQYAFIGPLVGALTRPVGGVLADMMGGAFVTFWTFVVMVAAVAGVLIFLPADGVGGSFWGFFAMFMLLFASAGIGNGSTFRMIPVIFMTERMREAIGGGPIAEEQAVREANKESAAVIGFTSAFAAYGGFFVPKSYGTSIAMTGSPCGALYAFIIFYVSCIAITWWYYSRDKAVIPC